MVRPEPRLPILVAHVWGVADKRAEAASLLEHLREREWPMEAMSHRSAGRPTGVQPRIRLRGERRDALGPEFGAGLCIEGGDRLGLNGSEPIFEVAVPRHR